MSPRYWIKQYGLQRSGTNYARAVLESSSPEIRVLAALLGDKHDLPDLDQGVELLRRGDVGVARTDLTADDYPSIIGAYETGELRVLVCVRDAVVWMDSLERYRARREHRPPQVLTRSVIEEHVDRWLEYYTHMHDWCQASSLRTAWVVHHVAVRKPDSILEIARDWSIPYADPVPELHYMRNGSDEHSSKFIGARKYRPQQYAEVYRGEGLLTETDVSWAISVIKDRDTRNLSRPWLWKGAPLRRRADRFPPSHAAH